eukprot:7274131-Karenia_brevis.AAC.1
MPPKIIIEQVSESVETGIGSAWTWLKTSRSGIPTHASGSQERGQSDNSSSTAISATKEFLEWYAQVTRTHTV